MWPVATRGSRLEAHGSRSVYYGPCPQGPSPRAFTFFFFFDQPNAVTHHTPPHTFSTSSDVFAEAHNALNGQGITHVVELGAEGIFSPVV